MKWLGWLIASLGGLLLLWLLSMAMVPPMGQDPAFRAAEKAEQILRACEAYRDHPQNPDRGKYPAMLADLAHPPFGGSSFLRNGLADLSDPWGQPFNYAVETNASGEKVIRVWSVRIRNGKQRTIEAIRRASGEVEVLGLD